MSERMIILGAGSWGTALALHAAKCGHTVSMWGHDVQRTRELALRRVNSAYLPGVRLPDSVRVDDRIDRTFADAARTVVLAVPSHHARTILEQCRPLLARDAVLVIATKGIEVGTLSLMTDVARESLGIPDERLCVLSGPSFAAEVAKGQPTAIVIASASAPLAETVQSYLSSESLRLYTSGDPVGVQVCGALKNVVAIAGGVVSGMGLGANALAALLTRGLAEMRRLGETMGAQPSTFAGLAGVGDLILTATGELSRNRRVGWELGQGRSPTEILAGMAMVAEGVRTAEAASQLAARKEVEMPIVEQVRRVLYDGVPPVEAISQLMSRRLRSEE